MESAHFPFSGVLDPRALPTLSRTTIKLGRAKRDGVAKIDEERADLATALPQVLARPYAVFAMKSGNWAYFGNPGIYKTVEKTTGKTRDVYFPAHKQLVIEVDRDLRVVRWMKIEPFVTDSGDAVRDFPGLEIRLFPT